MTAALLALGTGGEARSDPATVAAVASFAASALDMMQSGANIGALTTQHNNELIRELHERLGEHEKALKQILHKLDGLPEVIRSIVDEAFDEDRRVELRAAMRLIFEHMAAFANGKPPYASASAAIERLSEKSRELMEAENDLHLPHIAMAMRMEIAFMSALIEGGTESATNEDLDSRTESYRERIEKMRDPERENSLHQLVKQAEEDLPRLIESAKSRVVELKGELASRGARSYSPNGEIIQPLPLNVHPCASVDVKWSSVLSLNGAPRIKKDVEAARDIQVQKVEATRKALVLLKYLLDATDYLLAYLDENAEARFDERGRIVYDFPDRSVKPPVMEEHIAQSAVEDLKQEFAAIEFPSIRVIPPEPEMANIPHGDLCP